MVRVPHAKVNVLLKRLEAYRDNDPAQPREPGAKKPRDYARLVTSIAKIRRATLRQLWSDKPDDFPADDEPAVWELWLRYPRDGEPDPLPVLQAAANDFGYEVVSKPLQFVDRTVVLVAASAAHLASASDLLGVIARSAFPF